MSHFADRLNQAISSKMTPLVVGIDPRPERLPNGLRPEQADAPTVAAAYLEFSKGIIDAVSNHVAIVKPQAAFFELLGPEGMGALKQVVQYAQQAGLMVIMDAKRGDIGSTAIAYAKAFLGPQSAWQADSLTVNPYLGADTLEPFVNTAKDEGAGLFVLVKTSNPGSHTIQDRVTDGQTVYQKVASVVQESCLATLGESGYGIVGSVVGATYPEQLGELRQVMPNSIFLIPGLGAQGGKAEDLNDGFDENGFGAVINSSRAIIFAYEKPEYESCSTWQAAVEKATQDTVQQIAEHTKAGKLKEAGTL